MRLASTRTYRREFLLDSVPKKKKRKTKREREQKVSKENGILLSSPSFLDGREGRKEAILKRRKSPSAGRLYRSSRTREACRPPNKKEKQRRTDVEVGEGKGYKRWVAWQSGETIGVTRGKGGHNGSTSKDLLRLLFLLPPSFHYFT